METKKYSTSKSKTFDKESSLGDLIEWVANTLETENIEVITNTPADYDVSIQTKHKYKITIVNLNE